VTGSEGAALVTVETAELTELVAEFVKVPVAVAVAVVCFVGPDADVAVLSVPSGRETGFVACPRTTARRAVVWTAI
jgi:hypothetical protein